MSTKDMQATFSNKRSGGNDTRPQGVQHALENIVKVKTFRLLSRGRPKPNRIQICSAIQIFGLILQMVSIHAASADQFTIGARVMAHYALGDGGKSPLKYPARISCIDLRRPFDPYYLEYETIKNKLYAPLDWMTLLEGPHTSPAFALGAKAACIFPHGGSDIYEEVTICGYINVIKNRRFQLLHRPTFKYIVKFNDGSYWKKATLDDLLPPDCVGEYGRMKTQEQRTLMENQRAHIRRIENWGVQDIRGMGSTGNTCVIRAYNNLLGKEVFKSVRDYRTKTTGWDPYEGLSERKIKKQMEAYCRGLMIHIDNSVPALACDNCVGAPGLFDDYIKNYRQTNTVGALLALGVNSDSENLTHCVALRVDGSDLWYYDSMYQHAYKIVEDGTPNEDLQFQEQLENVARRRVLEMLRSRFKLAKVHPSMRLFLVVTRNGQQPMTNADPLPPLPPSQDGDDQKDNLPESDHLFWTCYFENCQKIHSMDEGICCGMRRDEHIAMCQFQMQSAQVPRDQPARTQEVAPSAPPAPSDPAPPVRKAAVQRLAAADLPPPKPKQEWTCFNCKRSCPMDQGTCCEYSRFQSEMLNASASDI